MMKKFALCAVLALALGLVACSSEETVAPAPESVAIEKDSADPVVMRALEDVALIRRWIPVDIEVDLQGGFFSTTVPDWSSYLLFGVTIIPDPGASPSGSATVTFEVPGFDPDDPASSERIFANCVPIRWSNIPSGDFTVVLGMSYAPWSIPHEGVYEFELHRVADFGFVPPPPESYTIPASYPDLPGPYIDTEINFSPTLGGDDWILKPVKDGD